MKSIFTDEVINLIIKKSLFLKYHQEIWYFYWFSSFIKIYRKKGNVFNCKKIVYNSNMKTGLNYIFVH
jgi:hypothetical protein